MQSNAIHFTNQKNHNIHLYVCKDYDTIRKKAEGLVRGMVNVKPDCILGLATGSSPIGMYEKLAELYRDGITDYSKVTTFNLDEYCALPEDNDQSYHYFMREHLFAHINVPAENIHIPSGCAQDVETECRNYDAAIAAAGGIDIQVLGIGSNGHIGFNEPADAFIGSTHLVKLKDSTIKANARFFQSEADVPRQAISMGIGSIMAAKKILLIAHGANKAKAIAATLEGPITPEVPASILQLHPDVVMLIDREAAAGLAEYKPEAL